MVSVIDLSAIDSVCPKIDRDFSGETVLVFGGSGSLGRAVVDRWAKHNKIVNVSRDEEKQWQLQSEIKGANLTQIIGDIANKDDVTHAILSSRPTVVCIFACLKHINLCEQFPEKAMKINSFGVLNVHETLLKYQTDVHTVLFVSTDKACVPMTTYGCTKAIAENFIQNAPFRGVKWVCVRYGNVLNSSGSILPHLRKQSTNANVESFTLTHPDMTRFIMTLQHSVNLIEYALLSARHGEIIVPFLYSIRIRDLFHIFESKYGKSVVITGLRCKEKIHEDLISAAEAPYTCRRGQYYHICREIVDDPVQAFDSSQHLVDEKTLTDYLELRSYI
jgi:UDP-N-acetylglucosamine 4,6-dehydratase/5-epimerase